MKSTKPAACAHAVFFDLDDTLYDHLLPFREALQAVLNTGDDFPYEPAYHRMRFYSDHLSALAGGTPTHGPVLEEMRTERFIRSLAEFGVTLKQEQAAAVQGAYLDRQFRIRPFDGAFELIGKLESDKALVGLITNGPPEHQWRKIRALELDRLIPPGLIYISGAVGITKPDRKLFDHVAAEAGLAPEQCCYVGDSWRNDVVGAAGAGWRTIWFNHRRAEPESAFRPHEQAFSYADLSRLLLGG
ncbi:HAD family hydrolase [Paenibacillus sp. FSL R5-0527]|uniref:HAD family hydrolase n=1 Tax=Paenibacillus sp. FSL R5-0527 TaxID=2975321 RepID=UPI00097B832D|nr:HAD family hydrolase [Paenibacillus macerans]